MVVRELLTRLNFEADQSKIDKFENSIGNLTKGLALLVTGATAAAAAMFSFATASARQSKEIDKGARLAGMNVEEFQKLCKNTLSLHQLIRKHVAVVEDDVPQFENIRKVIDILKENQI